MGIKYKFKTIFSKYSVEIRSLFGLIFIRNVGKLKVDINKLMKTTKSLQRIYVLYDQNVYLYFFTKYYYD